MWIHSYSFSLAVVGGIRPRNSFMLLPNSATTETSETHILRLHLFLLFDVPVTWLFSLLNLPEYIYPLRVAASPMTLLPVPERWDYPKETWDRICPADCSTDLVWTGLSIYFGCISAEKPRNIMLRKGLVSLRATSSLKKPVGNFFVVILETALYKFPTEAILKSVVVSKLKVRNK